MLPRAVPLAFCVLVAAATFGAAADDGMDTVTTSWPVEVIGIPRVAIDGGAAHVGSSADLGATKLEAERIEIRTSSWRGIEVTASTIVVDRDSDAAHLDYASVRFEQRSDEMALLAFSEEDGMSSTWDVSSRASLVAEPSVEVIGVGASPDTVAGGDVEAPGFWYTMEGPLLAAKGAGALRVSGSFTLFVHDVVIHAGSAQGEWSDWTGYWESDPDGVVTEFEFRVTTIEVENGTFVTSSSSGVDVFAPRLDSFIDGVLTSTAVNGSLLDGDDVLHFEDAPLRLRGTGTVQLEAFDADGEARVAIRPSHGFHVEGASRVEPVPGQDEGLSVRGIVAALGGLGVAALTTVALVTRGVVPVPMAASRRVRYERCFRRGHEHARLGEWELAASWYRRATRLRDDDPLAWFEWAHSELEAGNGAAAEEIARAAENVPGMDRSDLLELRAEAAWVRGDREAFDLHFSALSRESFLMARGLAESLDMPPEDRLSALRKTMHGARGPEGYIDGYA